MAFPVQTIARVEGGSCVVLHIISSRIVRRETSHGEGHILNVSHSLRENQLPVIRMICIQPNVLLLDGKAQEAPMNAVVDYGSPICILINEGLVRHLEEG